MKKKKVLRPEGERSGYMQRGLEFQIQKNVVDGEETGGTRNLGSRG